MTTNSSMTPSSTLAATRSSLLHQLRWTITDGLTLVGRELGRLRQDPGQIMAALTFPIIMVLLFGYVFGSAIQVPGGDNYREYLMPGLFAMVTFSSVAGVMTRMAGDASRGVMDRFRAMPTARLAVPFGHAGADLVSGMLMLGLMVGTGLLVGWQPHQGLIATAGAFLLMIALRYALSWVGVFAGLAVKDDEIADAMVPLFLPLTMLSNAFVPTDGMPGWLRLLADWNPMSALTAAARDLFGNPGAPVGDVAWPLAHPIIAVMLWTTVLLLIFIPLSLRAYMRQGR